MPLYTLNGLSQPPTLIEAATMLGTTVDAVDPSFGIIAIDPVRGRYCVNVYPSAAIDQSQWSGVEGPWSDPGVNVLAALPAATDEDGKAEGGS